MASPPARPRAHLPMEEITKLEDLFQHPDFLRKLGERIARGLDSDRFLGAFLQAVSKSETLQKCRLRSLFGACLFLAWIGLEPNNSFGHAYLIPRKVRGLKVLDENGQPIRENGKYKYQEDVYDADVMIGYQGYAELMIRGGDAKTVEARVVYATDTFDYEYGSKKFLRHKPTNQQAEGEKPAEVYCFITLKDGGDNFEVQPYDRVLLRSRDRSEAYQAALRSKAQAEAATKKADRDYHWRQYAESPWVRDEEEMVAKSLVRRIAKLMRKSPEFGAAVHLEDLKDQGDVDFGRMIDDAFLRHGVQYLQAPDEDDEPADFIEQGVQRQAEAARQEPDQTQQKPPPAQRQRQAPPPPPPEQVGPPDDGMPPAGDDGSAEDGFAPPGDLDDGPETVETRQDQKPSPPPPPARTQMDADRTQMQQRREPDATSRRTAPPPPPAAAGRPGGPKGVMVQFVSQWDGSSNWEIPKEAADYEAAIMKEIERCAAEGMQMLQGYMADNNPAMKTLFKADRELHDRIFKACMAAKQRLESGDGPG